MLSKILNIQQLTTETLPEYKTQALKKSRFILSHYGMFKGCWDWLILVATFYVAIVVPYNAAFVQADRKTMASDVAVEALFIIGDVLNNYSVYIESKCYIYIFLYRYYNELSHHIRIAQGRSCVRLVEYYCELSTRLVRGRFVSRITI